MKQCKVCQTVVEDEARFCPKCGAMLEQAEPKTVISPASTSWNEVKQEPSVEKETAAVTEQKKSGLATAALVLGIVGISLSFIPFIGVASLVLGVLGIVFGIIALRRNLSLPKSIVGLSLASIGLVIALLIQIIFFAALGVALRELELEEFSQSQTNSWKSSQSQTNSWESKLSIEIGEFEVIDNQYLDEPKLTVTVRNKTDERISVYIEIEAIDKNGYRLEDDWRYIKDLGAGNSERVDFFTYVDEDILDDMKNATFEIVEVEID
ncbi:MAG: hypothetical protein IKA44_02310 [Clostridia bacterium]|nr:hypothetical protein [Clostridia bacterium]